MPTIIPLSATRLSHIEESGELSRHLGFFPKRQHQRSANTPRPSWHVGFVHPWPSAKRPAPQRQ